MRVPLDEGAKKGRGEVSYQTQKKATSPSGQYIQFNGSYESWSHTSPRKPVVEAH